MNEEANPISTILLHVYTNNTNISYFITHLVKFITKPIFIWLACEPISNDTMTFMFPNSKHVWNILQYVTGSNQNTLK